MVPGRGPHKVRPVRELSTDPGIDLRNQVAGHRHIDLIACIIHISHIYPPLPCSYCAEKAAERL
jgi:hypothetical protein